MTLAPRRPGFTLIELLIVVVIIGILSAIAIPKFEHTVGKANTSSLRHDLHNLIVAEETYFYENQTYTTDTAALHYTTTKNVALTLGVGNGTGWSATATHAQASPIICGIFYGTAAPPLAATTVQGQVGCQ
jgi:type IV pilus assembly protein PilA